MEEVITDKVKVCCYCRVSTKSESQENSYENQQTYFNREIAKMPSFELTKIYPDKGISGTSFKKRKEFNKMIYDAGVDVREEKNNRGFIMKTSYVANTDRKPKFKYILIRNTSRFARNVLGMDVIRELRQKQVYIIFLDINKSTESESDELLLQILMTLDENDSKDKSRKVKFGLHEGALKGNINIPDKLYGYHYNKVQKEVEIIPKEYEIIKKIYFLYRNNFGFRRIINYCKAHNMKTRNGKDFCKATIRRILTNEKYYGCLVRNKYDTGVVFQKKPPKVRDKKDWIIHPNRIPAIITKEEFDEVQKIMENKLSTKTQKGKYKGFTEYVDLLICGKCGSHYVSNQDRGRKFYNCALKKREGTKACDNINVSKKIIDEKIESLCNGQYKKDVQLLKEFIIFVLNQYKDDLNKRIDNNTLDETKEKQKELNKLQEGAKRILDLYQNLEIEKDEYKKRMKTLNEKIDALKGEIKESSKSNDDIYKDISDIDKNIDDLIAMEVKDIYNKDEILKNIKFIEVNRDEKTNKPNISIIYNWMYTYKQILKKYGYQNAYSSLNIHGNVL